MKAEAPQGGCVTNALPLHGLPPYLRVVLLPCLRRERRVELGGWGSLGLAGPNGAVPSYMAAWSRDALLDVDAGTEELIGALENHIAAGGFRRDAADLFALITLLGAWDEAVREIGLYSGRLYLACGEAARRLFSLAGVRAPHRDSLGDLLLEAQSLELIYRFPVAFKFRRAYGPENQCRLNGWGRRLAERAAGDTEGAQLRERWHRRLRRHLLDHFDVYDRHIEYLESEGRATAPADSFALALRLPVPILL